MLSRSVGWSVSWLALATASISAQTTPVGLEFQVNSYTTNQQEDPAVATDSDGDFVVVWEGVYGMGDSYTAHGTIGVVGWQVTLLMTLATALVATGFLRRAGRLGELAELARSLGGAQPGGPPPPPPPG